MQALRSHPFLATVDWKTLWTSPAPPLEAGMLKKDPQPPGRTDGIKTWEDVGAAWDDLIDGGRDEDEMSWASDDAPEGFKFGSADTNDSGMRSYEGAVGPMGEVRPSAPLRPTSVGSSGDERNGRSTPQPLNQNGSTISDKREGSSHTPSGSSSGVRFKEAAEATSSLEHQSATKPVEETSDSGAEADEGRDTVAATLDDIPTAVRTQAIDVPFLPNGVRDSYSTGSSSSDGGSPPLPASLERGRNRSQTPIQGHGTLCDDEEWCVLRLFVIC
jgi:3-phosphoinositide dependent protein kinase-1